MRGPTKMFLLSNKMDPRRRGDDRVRMGGDPYGEMRNEMRGNYGSMNMNGHGEPYGEMESRFRDRRGREHYDNGRFAPRNAYSGDLGDVRPDSTPPQPRMIGFRYEEDGTRFRSNAGYMTMNEGERRTSRMDKGRAESRMQKHIDRQTAEEWTGRMQNADGTRGPHWSYDQLKQVMQQKQLDLDPTEFYVVMNMLFSDFSGITKQHGVNNVDFYCDMAKAFLDDKDAVEDKLMAYYEYIVKH